MGVKTISLKNAEKLKYLGVKVESCFRYTADEIGEMLPAKLKSKGGFEVDREFEKADFHEFCLMIAGVVTMAWGMKEDEDVSDEVLYKRVTMALDRIKEMADIMIESRAV